MKPRHKAAENVVRRVVEPLEGHLASMKPRHKAAENIIAAVTAVGGFFGLQ